MRLFFVIIFSCFWGYFVTAQDLSIPFLEQIQKQSNFSGELVDIKINPSFQEATITNKKGNVLRFRFDAKTQTLLTFPYEVVFLHYTFEKGLITGVNYLNHQGTPIDIPYLADGKIAAQQFKRFNLKQLKQDLDALSQNDGNATSDDKAKKLVQVLYLNATGNEVHKTYMSTVDYWGFQHLLHRL